MIQTEEDRIVGLEIELKAAGQEILDLKVEVARHAVRLKKLDDVVLKIVNLVDLAGKMAKEKSS